MTTFRYLSLVPFLIVAACGDNAAPPGGGSSSGGSSSSSSGNVPQDGGADVIPAASISLAIADATVIQGSAVELTLQLTRGASVTGDVGVKFATLPLGLGLPVGDLVFKAGQSTLKVQLSAGIDGKQGDAKLSATATTLDGATSSKKDFTVLVRGAPGTLDKTFGVDGTFTRAEESAASELVASDTGAVYIGGAENVGGQLKPFVAKLTPAGALDTSFGTTGVVSLPAAAPSYVGALALGPDGRIYVGVRPSNANAAISMVRLSAAGVIDAGFAPASTLVASGSSGPAFGDQGIAVTSQKVFWRYAFNTPPVTVSGRVDFLTLGGAQEGTVISVGSAPDSYATAGGGLVACGSTATLGSASNVSIKRFTPTGAPDGAYSPAGTGRCSRLAALSGGSIGFSGTAGFPAENIAGRLKSDLTPDPTFGTAGRVTLPFLPTRLAADQLDRMVFFAVDGGQYVARRHLAGGNVDLAFGTSGEVRFGTSVEGGVAAAVQKNNRVLVGGLFPSGGMGVAGVMRFWD